MMHALAGVSTTAFLPSRFNETIKVLNNLPQWFDFVMRGISDSFTTLGVPHELVSRVTPNDTSLYIMISTHIRDTMPKRYISYNFEQLVKGHMPKDVFERFAAAEEVWDYSKLNIAYLSEHYGITAQFVPLGYAQSMELCNSTYGACGLQHAQQRNCSVMFLGAQTEHRMKDMRFVFDEVGISLPSPYIAQQCWGQCFADAHRLCRVSLNIPHFVGKSILNVHRILPLIANGVAVVSYPSEDHWYNRLLEDSIFLVDGPHAMARTVKRLLALPDGAFAKLTSDNYMRLRLHANYVDFLREAICS
jgi:hypothetical protein